MLFCRKTIYVNIFTGEAAKKFPQATQMARGGVSLFPAVDFKLFHVNIQYKQFNFFQL